MAVDKTVEAELLETVGVRATEAFNKEWAKAEQKINEKAADFAKGLMTAKELEDFKKESLEPINKTLASLETASKEQGTKMQAIIEQGTPGQNKTIEQFITDLAPQIKEIRAKGSGFIEFSGAQLKAAGVNSIAGAIPVASPYAPGIGGVGLDVFDVVRNPNFITSKVDLGRTNQSRLAWANEKSTIEGSAALVAEGGLKPQSQHKFEIETSTAKKIASWIEITEEFDQDLPQFSTLVRRMLQVDVERAWDDQIQTDVQTAARPFEITGLNASTDDANYWDAAYAMMGQVGYYNFMANTFGINWLTNYKLNTEKNANNTYLLPPFAGEINSMKTYANKMAVDYALVGDLKQYKVDILRDFYLKIGYINDELIYNKYAVVGELRYHSYISDARKKALVYDSLIVVDAAINKP